MNLNLGSSDTANEMYDAIHYSQVASKVMKGVISVFNIRVTLIVSTTGEGQK